MANPEVRQALNYAVNKDAVIGITTLGLGKPMGSFMSAATPLFADQDLYKYDPAKARTLLAEAGFPNGFETSVLALSGNADEANNLAIIQQTWGQVGAKLRIDLVDNATRTACYRTEDFAMCTSLSANDVSDPSQVTSYAAYYLNIHSLHSQCRDERVDELFVASQQQTDPAACAAEYKEIQERYCAAAPVVFLYETPLPRRFPQAGAGLRADRARQQPVRGGAFVEK